MKSFSAKIFKIGVNPYVLVPLHVLNELFRQSGKTKGTIPIRGTLNGNKYIQTLVKYRGRWRLYLNTPMRKGAGIDVGDLARFQLEFDPAPRILIIHAKLQNALDRNKKASTVFQKLPPSYQKEIVRYINLLKTEEAVNRNVEKAIQHLLGNTRFAGRNLNIPKIKSGKKSEVAANQHIL